MSIESMMGRGGMGTLGVRRRAAPSHLLPPVVMCGECGRTGRTSGPGQSIGQDRLCVNRPACARRRGDLDAAELRELKT